MHSHRIQLQMGVEVQLFSYIRSRLVGHSPHGPPLPTALLFHMAFCIAFI